MIFVIISNFGDLKQIFDHFQAIFGAFLVIISNFGDLKSIFDHFKAVFGDSLRFWSF